MRFPQGRCFARASVLVLWTALAVICLPSHMIAQQGTAEANKPSEAAKPTQEEQNNAFRLNGPIVQWAARSFHTSPETAATGFEFLNFGIIVLGIGIPLFRFLPKLLRNRSGKLRGDLESARKETENAQARLNAVEAKLAGLQAEIAEFRAQVESESQQDEARIKGAITDESARIVAAAEQELAVAAAQVVRGLRSFAADLAIEQAAQQLHLTPESDQACIASFLGDLSQEGGN